MTVEEAEWMKRLGTSSVEAGISDTRCTVKNGCFHIEKAERRTESCVPVAMCSGQSGGLLL